jgi:glutamyl-tRNA synthetase
VLTGRYAPSPSGDQHLGNLRTALLAWLQARLLKGRFLLRIEDLDTPRVVAGSADQILRDLQWLGLDWDGSVVKQSQRSELYQRDLQTLSDLGLVYPCFCSRKDIQQAASAPHGNRSVYPGTCAHLNQQSAELKSVKKDPALRLRVNESEISFVDGVVGSCQEVLAHSCGDFVIKRADGLFAYQLAVIVDDIEQGVTHVLRGADLLESTARQIYIAEQLTGKLSLIDYSHVPLMADDQGNRMAKRDKSYPVAQGRSRGKSAEDLVGFLAYSSGLLPQAEPISTDELLQHICYADWQQSLKQKK